MSPSQAIGVLYKMAKELERQATDAPINKRRAIRLNEDAKNLKAVAMTIKRMRFEQKGNQ